MNDIPFPQLPDEGQAVSIAYGVLGVLGDDVLSFQGHKSLRSGEAHMLGEAPHTLPASYHRCVEQSHSSPAEDRGAQLSSEVLNKEASVAVGLQQRYMPSLKEKKKNGRKNFFGKKKKRNKTHQDKIT